MNILDENKDNHILLDEYNFTYEIQQGKDGNDIVIFTAVNSFPLGVLNELLSVWYGKEDSDNIRKTGLEDYLQGEIILSPPIKIIGDYFDYVDPDSVDD